MPANRVGYKLIIKCAHARTRTACVMPNQTPECEQLLGRCGGLNSVSAPKRERTWMRPTGTPRPRKLNDFLRLLFVLLLDTAAGEVDGYICPRVDAAAPAAGFSRGGIA